MMIEINEEQREWLLRQVRGSITHILSHNPDRPARKKMLESRRDLLAKLKEARP